MNPPTRAQVACELSGVTLERQGRPLETLAKRGQPAPAAEALPALGRDAVDPLVNWLIHV